MPLSRRTALKQISLGAGALALSPLTGWGASRRGVARLSPTRFVFVVEGGGLPREQILPASLARRDSAQGWTEPLADNALPESLNPLSRWRDRLSVVTGLSADRPATQHSSHFATLAVAPCGTAEAQLRPMSQTLDCVLAEQSPCEVPQLVLGISQNPHLDVIENLSASAPGVAVPTYCRPDLARAELFGKQSRSLDCRLSSEMYSSTLETDRLQAHFDLAGAALTAGRTSVVTIASGVGEAHFDVVFRGLGIGLGKHEIGHGRRFNGMSAEEMSLRIRRFHFSLIAQLAERLNATREGAGTMLDRTLIVYLSDGGDGHHATGTEWPLVVLGDMPIHGNFINHRARSFSLGDFYLAIQNSAAPDIHNV